MKAAVLSFVIPGGGQFYNESYLKSGIVFGLEASLIALTVYHQIETDHYYDKYRRTTNHDFYKKYIKYYNKKQSDYWWTGAVIFLSTIDAYVDAHLYDFDSKKEKVRLKFFANNAVGLEYRF